MYQPTFTITPAITKALMTIEAARQSILALPIDVDMLASLRETARLIATHYSTQIEGNRLTQAEVEQVLSGAHIPGRERDQTEVRNYYRALEEVERLSGQTRHVEESDIQRLHGLVLHGKIKPAPYRDGQNVIRAAGSGLIIYMPPEAANVPDLMADLIDWISAQTDRDELPAPLIAAVAHYQFATVHPYYDGNGRTARLLATLLLHKAGYGLKGIYSLDEYYARNLQGYYQALTVGPSHNYYMGRADSDITGFIAYFCAGMAEAFTAVKAQADKAASRGAIDQSGILRRLDPRQRRLWELLRRQGTATSGDIATHLGLSPRTVVSLCRQWVDDGFLEVHDPSRKNRAYRLAGGFDRD
ncbi:MAG: Fic family protein [Azospirillaceae bacterium]|nr:Fic family protein [Azospirillaceae bacterium]